MKFEEGMRLKIFRSRGYIKRKACLGIFKVEKVSNGRIFMRSEVGGYIETVEMRDLRTKHVILKDVENNVLRFRPLENCKKKELEQKNKDLEEYRHGIGMSGYNNMNWKREGDKNNTMGAGEDE